MQTPKIKFNDEYNAERKKYMKSNFVKHLRKYEENIVIMNLMQSTETFGYGMKMSLSSL
jgi:hypothetical protein